MFPVRVPAGDVQRLYCIDRGGMAFSEMGAWDYRMNHIWHITDQVVV